MSGDFISVRNIFSNIKIHNKNQLKEKNITHYLFTYDLLEYNFKDIYKTLSISYFSKDDNLLEHLVNPEELQYYESVEETAKNKESILIKKFKFRITVRKNSDFSKEMIISDDYDFDVNILHHVKYLIKVAMVKDNADKWIAGQNLKDYDFIFTTNKEAMDLLKKSNIASFLINGDSVYVQFKNILNYLNMRKPEKFYEISKRFDHAFPKQNNYFKVLNSQYFDDEWYRDTYGTEDNTDSVIHFLLVGCKKGCNPGPDFSVDEYYECNTDVKKTGMNPLVHYESYGRKENRIIHVSDIPKRDYSLILNSQYFDKDWYENTYDIPDDVDSVAHYLNEGYLKRYNPGPDFNTHEYYQCNNDIKKIGMNPLVHYELYGRKEKRKTALSDDVNQENRDYILNSPYFDKEWYSSNYNIPEDMDPAYHYLNIGFAKGYNPGTEFSTSEYYQCYPDVENHGMNPLLHFEKYGRNEGRVIHLSDLKKKP